MKIKKNVLIGVLVTAMLAGMALAINASMAYAKDYDGLANTSSKTNEKKEKEEEAEYLIKCIGDKTYGRGIRHKEGLNFDEGITVEKGVRNAEDKIEQWHAGYAGSLDFYVTVLECKTPTLESNASWEMTFIIENPNVSETEIVMEVDKQTGTCIEKSVDEFIFEPVRTIGRFTVRQQKMDRTFDFNEGITVEKAIQLVEEKTKKMYGINFSNEVGISNGSRTINDNEEEWWIFSTPAGQTGKWAHISSQINKYTGEITQYSYVSNELGVRREASSSNQPSDPNININATRKEVKEEILKYASTQQSSEYHQSAIDFIKKHNLNQGATIEKVQGILESDTMLQFDYDKNGWRYFVEAELDNGKYIIVEVEKETKESYGYYETSQSLEERLDAQIRTYEKLDRMYEQMEVLYNS